MPLPAGFALSGWTSRQVPRPYVSTKFEECHERDSLQTSNPRTSDAHSALVVQAGTMSTRGRGEVNSFNVVLIARPHITVERHTWDEAHETFLTSWSGAFQYTARGWTMLPT